MNQMSTDMNQNKDSIEWRRNKVQELVSQGYNQSEISKILQISRPTITRDIQYLSKCAKQNIKKYIDERLPEEYEKCMVGLTAITKEAWIHALSLAKECYSMKMDLLTNATVVDDAIKFVNHKINTDVRSKDEQKDVENDMCMTKNEIF